MPAKLLVEYVSIIELVLLCSVLVVLAKRRLLGEFKILASFIGARAAYGAFTISLLYFHSAIGVSGRTAYTMYAYSYMPALFGQTLLMVLVVYSIYNMALAPFEPLRKLGTIIFRWVSAITFLVTAGIAIGPRMMSGAFAGGLMGEFQEMACVITLCLLLFVTFALRPLGLTARSRAFGASLGLGLIASVELVQSAWFEHAKLGSMVNFYSGLGFCAAVVVWGVYFAIPQTERQMVLLPTTSPYFFWNKISEALGDAPGFVAISGFKPEHLAAAELSAMMMPAEPKPETMRPIMLPIAVNSR